MQRAVPVLLAVCFIAGVFVGGVQAQVNPGCALTAVNRYDCPIRTGNSTYQAQFDRNKPHWVEHIRIHNDTSGWFQLQVVSASTDDFHWGEYSIYLDHFATRQDSPGVGEVAARDWDPFVKSLPLITWDAHFLGRGLKIPPGSTFILHNNADAMFNAGVDTATITYGVEVAVLTNGVDSYRQPRIDEPFRCNNRDQETVWNPWPNNTGQVWRVDGATIYAVVPQGTHQVDAACVYILNTNGQVRWQHCSGVNRRGQAAFPQQTVQPGESLAAQARHRCPRNGYWDWVAFLQVR